MDFSELNDKKVFKTYKTLMLVMLAVILLAAIVIGFFTRADDFIKVTEDNRLLFSPEGGDTLSIPLLELDSIELAESLTIENLDAGQTGRGYTCGVGTAEGLGTVRYYAYDRTSRFIVIKSGGEVIAFNYYNNQNTEDFYKALCDLRGETL